MENFELDPGLNHAEFTAGPPLKIHLLGIGGVAMAALAGLLTEAGHLVTGSDGPLYPPTSEILDDLGLTVFSGYGPETLPPDSDLVVVGNVVTRAFPVLARLKELGRPYLSLPQALDRFWLDRTRNLVVAGSHGKTTTTALAARIFETAGLDPGFLIGGDGLDFPRPFRLPRGGWFIIEGDEYDSAFFDKRPKFIHYRPHTVILTSVEFDHADIYPDLDAVIAAFESLMGLIPAEGRLIAWGDSPLVRRVAAWTAARAEFYGLDPENDWRVSNLKNIPSGSEFELAGPEGFFARLSLNRPGVYNVLNAAAASAALLGAGGDGRALAPALAGFKGVRRRQEVLGDFGGVTLVDDFAHHPTAVAATLTALKAAHGGRRLLAAFEPRSNTSRRAVFQKDYAAALALADLVFLRRPPDPHKAPADDRLDPDRLADDLGGRARLFDDGLSLGTDLADEARAGDIIVVMSNGGFDGLTGHLKARLSEGISGEPDRPQTYFP
ncbi:MAG: Mur ligase domain-containing protein [Candidatus Adiutrix sp.]|jgi:UDP-N-acetylmuramate: L-alanyl-gamma-D-glutamyl-meso-diaminopimelate ligase|nr:Mur ligase domain-containing protein [Candidatus Adiutrix sp.]